MMMKMGFVVAAVLYFVCSLAFGQGFGGGSNPIQQMVMDQIKNSQAAAAARAQQAQGDQQYNPSAELAGGTSTNSNASQTEIQQSNQAAGLGIQQTQQYQNAQQQLNQSQSNKNTINQGANKGKKSQSSGAGMNMAASAMLMAACMASQPPNIPLCIMGAMAAAQGAHDSGASNKSGKTADASKMGYSTPGAAAQPEADNGSAGFPTSPEIDQGMETLKKEGYAVNENGVTFPDGSFKPASAYGSAASMAAAGLDPKAASDAAAVLAKLNTNTEDPNQPKLVNMAVDGSPGGYSPASSSGDTDNGSVTNRNPWAISADARRKMVEGKSMNLAGEPIGVKGDDLFDMVHRAYEKKRKTANFIEGDIAPASVRAPASANSH